MFYSVLINSVVFNLLCISILPGPFRCKVHIGDMGSYFLGDVLCWRGSSVSWTRSSPCRYNCLSASPPVIGASAARWNTVWLRQKRFSLGNDMGMRAVSQSDLPRMLLLAEMLLYVHRNRRFIRDGSPGRPPRLSYSSWALSLPFKWPFAFIGKYFHPLRHTVYTAYITWVRTGPSNRTDPGRLINVFKIENT